MEYSVLMTVYRKDNSGFFRDALLSMVNQTRKPNEIVLVKDGPIPECLQNVIDAVKNKTPGIITEIQLEKNIGLGVALNQGLKVCRNELVARMDSDDISLPTRCEKQIERFENNPSLDIIGCPVLEFVGTPDNVIGERQVPLDDIAIKKFAKRRDPFNHPTVMYRKSKVMKFGPYGNFRKNQDTALWIEMLNNNCVAENLPDYLVMFRFDEDTYKKRKSWVNTKLLIKIRWYGFMIGFNSLFDFVLVMLVQLNVYIMPMWFQKFVYTRVLRK